MKKIAAILLALILAAGAAGCGTQTVSAPSSETSNTQTSGEAGEATGFDGTYQGEGNGNGGKIQVKLTIQDSKIAAIEVVSHSETAGIADAMNKITEQMIATNSLSVDAVSGATNTSKGFLEAVADAFAKTGQDPSILVASESNLVAEVRESAYTADVVVVGAGGAGMTAAIEAAAAGASVILVEKMPMAGGNTLISGAEMAAPQNWIQEKEGIEDSADKMYEDTLKGGDNQNDPALVRILADNALAGGTWLRDEVNVTFEDYLLFFGGHSVKRSLVPLHASGVELVNKLLAKTQSYNIPLHNNTKAVELIKDEAGKVVGVKGDFQGQEITYTANKAVILATGGFGYNLDMRKQHNPEMDEKILSTNTVGSMGDGIVMGEKVGAQVVDLEYIQTYPTCDIETGALLYVGDVRLEGRSIMVNKEGKRFVEELERRDVISRAVTQQTGNVSYMFWDESAMTDSGVNVKHQSEYDSLIARGKLVKADTIEQAAAFFEIDAAQLQTTVDAYNQYAKDGKDLEFNKRGELVEFGSGPYYIMVSKPAVHHTMGGLKINTNAQVLDGQGQVINGLYAAGEVTGDIHGTNRLGSNAIADITVFGRIAGQNAAN